MGRERDVKKMAVKTLFTHNDFVNILSQYDLGAYTQSEAIQQGTVQTNFFTNKANRERNAMER